MKKLEGQVFGRWTVIKDSEKRTKDRAIIWECKCTCGTVRNVTFKILSNKNKPRSCGCIRKENSIKLFHTLYEKTVGCWIWKGVIGIHGYGKIGTHKTAHREAYKYVYGEIPKGKQVCHKCDNRLCVNPAHLFLGSIGDNMRDRTEKNRQAKGSRIASSTLTEEQVLEIRKLRLQGKEYQELADQFKTGWYNIRMICKNKSWQHVALGKECHQYISNANGFSSMKIS
jgi:HNH endonuclease